MPRSNRPHLLFLSPYLPRPDQASGCVRLFNLLRILAPRYRIFFATPGDPLVAPYHRQLQEIGIKVLPRPCRTPLDLAPFFSRTPPAGIFVEFYHLACDWLAPLRHLFPQSRIFVDSVDVSFVRHLGEADLRPGDHDFRAWCLREKQVELDAYRRADAVLVVSPRDRTALRRAAIATPLALIPNIHHLPPFPSSHPTRDLLFVGNLRHAPNRDAVLFLFREIRPRLLPRLPGVGIDIIGPHVPPEIRRLQQPRFRVLGYVPHLAPFLRQRRLFLAPLRFGAGMKGKIGLALAHGLATVTTPYGTEGLLLRNRREVLVATGPEAFARTTAEAYHDETLRTRLARNGYETLARHFSDTHLAPLVLQEVKRLLALPRTQASPGSPAFPSRPRSQVSSLPAHA